MMRTIKTLEKALFAKPGHSASEVHLPHTWNAQDGQDGNNDYWRGKGTYTISLPAPTPGMRQYISFEGANHVAEVSCNGRFVGIHKGGFSTFHFELMDFLQPGNNVLTVTVDNDSPCIYPQKADFTFFGGLYRPVSWIEVPVQHFDLLKDGTQGIFVTAQADGATRVDLFTTDAEGCTVRLRLLDADGRTVHEATAPAAEHTAFECKISQPHLWDGRRDPYCYRAEAVLERNGNALDTVQAVYGYRSFSVDANRGFFLNGKSNPLHGVSRHQDRQDMGWAITEAEHRQDMELIAEIGANAVRLAHYQHSQVFYDLCDRYGMAVWAEIPFISQFMAEAEAQENTETQLRELIAQNYNHPSIFFWGISNEITMTGESDALYENLCRLNALAKQLDPGRLTTMAHLNTVPAGHPHTEITDVQGFNVYKGWYIGEIGDNAPYLDEMHAAMPNRPIALSEYGADADVRWHSASPRNHDYTEEYQALYHEGLLKTFAARPYLWGTFVWNMFDFAADARSEGGVKGRNCKGLVSYDRTVCKDAFYIYKAYWTDEPMIHLCGKRFANRAPSERTIKVYTNCPEVSLRVNGVVTQTQTAQDHICVFENVPLVPGRNEVCAFYGEVQDGAVWTGVGAHDKSYDLPPEEGIAGNWFDEATGEQLTMEFPEGFLSIRDTIGELLEYPEVDPVILELQRLMGRVSPGESDDVLLQKAKAGMQAIKHLTFQQMTKFAGSKVSPVALIRMNQKLNKIPKH